MNNRQSSSPNKITFNYANQPQQVQQPVPIISASTYSPRIIQSGFILGQPVAYTGAPYLPNQFKSFSPNRPRATTDFIASSRNIQYQAPEPSRFAPPARSSLSPSPRYSKGVTHQQFNRLLHKYNDLESRYKQLQQRYYDLQNQSGSVFYHREGANSNSDIIPLIERYRQNLMDEFRLLMDRARLEEKQEEIQRSRRR